MSQNTEGETIHEKIYFLFLAGSSSCRRHVTLTNKGIRDEESLEMLTIIMDRRTYDFSMFLEFGTSFPYAPGVCYRNLIATNNSNITSYYEKYLSQAEKSLKTLSDTILSFDD